MMGMGTKILTMTIVLMNSIFFAYPLVTPFQRCTSDGSKVCVDCFRTATCVKNSNGTFTVVEDVILCPQTIPTYCDDSLFSSENYGQCSPIPASITKCSCSTTTTCVADPNNSGTVLHCESDPPVTDPPCPPPALLDLTKCKCLTTSSTCSLVDNPNDDCAKYYYYTGEGYIEQECPDSFCFDQSACQCIRSETAAAPITCSDECPFVDDPTDECSKYYYCTDEGNIEQECPLSFCFDQSACQCVPSETKAAPIKCSDECPFVDDPTDECSKYYFCSGDGSIYSYACPTGFCFNQDACSCT